MDMRQLPWQQQQQRGLDVRSKAQRCRWQRLGVEVVMAWLVLGVCQRAVEEEQLPPLLLQLRLQLL